MSDLKLPSARGEIVQRRPRFKRATKFLPEIRVQTGCFVFGGGAWLGRWILDHPEEVRGKRFLDVAAGSGVLAIAAAKADATEVTAIDIEPTSIAAIKENAQANNVHIITIEADAAFETSIFEGQDVIGVADVFYRGAKTEIQHQLLAQVRAGKTVLAASWSEVPLLLMNEGELLFPPVTCKRPPNLFRKIASPQAVF